MCVLFPRIACFRIEDDEELAGESDGDDHQRLSGIAQPLVECLESVMEAGRSSGDEEHDGPDRATSTTGDAASLALAAVIALRREAQELGDGLAIAGADLRQVAIRRATARPATPPEMLL